MNKKEYRVLVCDKLNSCTKVYKQKSSALRKAELLSQTHFLVVVEEYINFKLEVVYWFNHDDNPFFRLFDYQLN